MPYVCTKHGCLTSLYNIPGYQLIHKGRSCSEHGGLMTFLDEEYSYTVRDLMIASDLWEGLFINIHHEHLPQNLTLGNIYRPPKKNDNNDVIHQFNTELRPIFDQLGKENKNSIITGDMNINLLNKGKDKVPRILRCIRIKRTFSENSLSDQIFEIRKKVHWHTYRSLIL